MPRRKIITDPQVYATVRHLLATGGDKAAAFASVGRAAGLAPATLAQRYGSVDGMLRLALMDAWDILDATLTAAEVVAEAGPKGAQTLLKALDAEAPLSIAAHNLRDAALRKRAADWRARVEAALTLRLGGGAKSSAQAAMLFSVWQGQALWRASGGKGFRMKDAVKRLT